MSEVLVPLATGEIRNVWIEVLVERLSREIERAEPGQCLRVNSLPRTILTEAARRIHDSAPAHVNVSLVDHASGPEPWRVGVHKVVEQRNLGNVVVVAAFPPDLKLAAGDSVDVSTFRELRTTDLGEEVEALLVSRIPALLREKALEILADLTRRGRGIGESARHEYLALIAHQHSADPSVLGGALYVLGLIPDFGLLDRPDELAFRIGQRNLQIVDALSASTGTLLQRILHLPISDAKFRERLRQLFTSVPGSVREWGAAIATDRAWRDLSLDRWPFTEEIARPEHVAIEISPLRLPRRPEDGLPLYDLRKPSPCFMANRSTARRCSGTLVLSN